jgi:hypothetical protein
MAWSPPARQRRFWLAAQAGDYAAQISYHTRDGTTVAIDDQTAALTLSIEPDQLG